MRVAFYAHHFSFRGTEVALFDYAKYNKDILCNDSFIIIDGNQSTHKNPAREKFLQEFGELYSPKNIIELEQIISENKIDVFYNICSGSPEPLPSNCKTVIHSVFPGFTPFGNVYAYVSEWLYKNSVPQNKLSQYDFVPHIVNLPQNDQNMRDSLSIPKDAIVFGYHGGSDSFNIEFAKKSVSTALNKNKYFVFMNIPRFINHPNVRFLDATYDLNKKTMFINTCDAMIHARHRGETFGLSIGEFSIRNKPIITFGQSDEKNHLFVLKDKALVYNNEMELDNILSSFCKTADNYDCYTQLFNPKTVMEKFKSVFLSTP